MLIYSGTVTLYLAYAGLAGFAGILLWPTVILHAILTLFLARVFQLKSRDDGPTYLPHG
jgi:hypothetical protein